MWVTYKEKLRHFSDQLFTVSKAVRLLDSIRWPVSVLEQVRKSNYRELPKIDRKFYEKIRLEFDPEKKYADLSELQKKIERDIGSEDPLAQIFIDTCEQHKAIVSMLQSRGTRKFYELSRSMYGSAKDTFVGSSSTIKDLGVHLYNILSKIDETSLGETHERLIRSDQAARELNKRFKVYFQGEKVTAAVDQKIIADAVAANRMIRLRQKARFSQRDIDILEVHEGWVHLGTSINGSSQKILSILGKGSPRATATQEGLAILMEIFSFVTLPRRARKINDRVLAIDKAEDGANFLEVLEYFRTEGYSEQDCLMSTQRVFRGGTVTGGAPFTKDLAYCKGFVEIYNFIRACIESGRAELLPMLFAGKVRVQDVPVLYAKYKEGIIDAPRYLPPFFRDLNSLVVWMSFSNFLHAADMAGAQQEYRNIILKS